MILAGPEQGGRPVGSGSGAPAGAGANLHPRPPAEVEVTDGGPDPHQPER